MSFSITSPAFDAEREIPKRYACDDKGIFSPLQWPGVPEASQSLILIMNDPEVPEMTWIHWVLNNLPSETPMMGTYQGGA